MSELRNNPDLPLVPNGKRRHGQFEWHNADCQVEMYGERTWPPMRFIWCVTHGQWAHEVPVKVEYIFEDGTKVSRNYEEL